MSDFWSGWIIVLTAVSYVLLAWLLLSNRKINQPKDGATTGHIYDGIEEYDNPMPSWWIKMFVLSMVFGAGYLLAYPGMGKFPGLLNWTSVSQWQGNVDAAKQKNEALYAEFMEKDAEALVADPKAMRIAKRVFANNCAICHGNDAKGSYGFPNLTDNDWLYGGSPDQIAHSIRDGRSGMMPGWQSVLGAEGVKSMAAYVQSLRDAQASASAEQAESREKFTMLCAGCHGASGEGNIAMGAPRLNDDTWLYGGDTGKIIHSIANGRSGKMPAHANNLSAAKIHLLSAYVYQLAEEEP